MKTPPTLLIDGLIDYAHESGLSLCDAAVVVSEFAKQRAPERAVESQVRDAHYRLGQEVQNSPKEYIVARFLARTRVQYISWTYYPEYHVFESPRNFWWCSIWFENPNWEQVIQADRFYLDDLFHDPSEGKFWMKEPYLVGLSESTALFQELTKKKYQVMEGTAFRKVDPRIVGAFKATRMGRPEFATRALDFGKASRNPHYGAKGWKNRIMLVPVSYKRVRLK